MAEWTSPPARDERLHARGETVLPFERPEYLERIANVKRRMDAAGIDVLLISDPCNMNYLTGYDATSYYVHQMVALALDAEEPLWIGRQMDVACARFTTFLQEKTCAATRRATSASPTGTPWSSWR